MKSSDYTSVVDVKDLGEDFGFKLENDFLIVSLPEFYLETEVFDFFAKEKDDDSSFPAFLSIDNGNIDYSIRDRTVDVHDELTITGDFKLLRTTLTEALVAKKNICVKLVK